MNWLPAPIQSISHEEGVNSQFGWLLAASCWLLARRLDEPARNPLACFAQSRVVQAKNSHVLELELTGMPQPKACPLRIGVSPPSHAYPFPSFVDLPRPSSTANVVPGYHIGRPQTQRLKLSGIVKIAYHRFIGKVKTSDCPAAPRQAWTAFQYRRTPLSE